MNNFFLQWWRNARTSALFALLSLAASMPAHATTRFFPSYIYFEPTNGGCGHAIRGKTAQAAANEWYSCVAQEQGPAYTNDCPTPIIRGDGTGEWYSCTTRALRPSDGANGPLYYYWDFYTTVTKTTKFWVTPNAPYADGRYIDSSIATYEVNSAKHLLVRKSSACHDKVISTRVDANGTLSLCELPVYPIVQAPPGCIDGCSPAGNPVEIATAEKFENIKLFQFGDQQLLMRYTHLTDGRWRHSWDFSGASISEAISSGVGFGYPRHNAYIVINGDVAETVNLDVELYDDNAFLISMPGGRFIAFNKLTLKALPETPGLKIYIRQGGGYVLHNEMEGRQYIYDALLNLKSIYNRNGLYVYFIHTSLDGTCKAIGVGADGTLKCVKDPFSREVGFIYLASGSVGVVDPAGQLYNLKYANGALSEIIFPDLTSKRFLYQRHDGRDLLTGVKDESEVLLSQFTYNYDRSLDIRTTTTERTGGIGRFSVTRQEGSGKTILVDPLGTERVYEFADINGFRRFVGVDKSTQHITGYSYKKVEHDALGNVIYRDDFNGIRTCYVNDALRALVLYSIEGLPAGSTCSHFTQNLGVFSGTARKISTQWHPDWRLETRRAEPLKRTTWVYNGQPDPFNGGATATCTTPMYGASAVAPLPDGKPIAVLCKQVEQATLDASGVQGFDAAINTAVPSRVTQYTYNQYGQMLKATDARNNTTTYTYYSDTVADPLLGHTKGDLWKVSNALGHITEYTKYNPHGQVLEVKDPNGLVSSYSYDLRQRMTGMSQAGQNTAIEYWPTGLLKKVTRPDASWLLYTYDDAHRLTDVSDNLGNKVHYTLDNAGNRIKEEVSDTSGSLTWQIDRTYDALNRLWTTRTGVPQ